MPRCECSFRLPRGPALSDSTGGERERFVRLDECTHAEGEPNVFRAGCEYGLDLDADIVLDISGEIEAERDR